MARSDFGGTPGDTTWGAPGPNGEAYFTAATATCWTAETGGTQHTGLLLNGVSVDTLPIAADAQIPVFSGPDGVTSLWIEADSGHGPGARRILRAAGSGGGSPITDNGDGTLTISGKTFYSKARVDALLADLQDTLDANSAAIDGNTAAIAALLPNAMIVVWDGSHWTYKGDVITARPTSDTDYVMIALYNSTQPSFMINGTDLWLQDLGA